MTHIKDTTRDVNSLEMHTPTSVIQLAHKRATTFFNQNNYYHYFDLRTGLDIRSCLKSKE